MNGYDETKYISCKGCGCEIEADQRKYPYCKTINLSAPKKNSNKLSDSAFGYCCCGGISDYFSCRRK